MYRYGLHSLGTESGIHSRGPQGSQTPVDPRIRVWDSFPAWDPRIRVWDSLPAAIYIYRYGLLQRLCRCCTQQQFTFPGTGCCNVWDLYCIYILSQIHSSNLHFPGLLQRLGSILYIYIYYIYIIPDSPSGIHSLGTESGIHSITYISIYDKPYILLLKKRISWYFCTY